MTTNQTPEAKKGAGARNAPKKAKKAPKPKKPMPRFMIAVITFLIFVMLLAGGGYCLYTNIGGVAEKALVMLPQYRKSVTAVDKQQKDLTTKQQKLQADRDKLTDDLKAVTKKTDDLKTREDKLLADQQAFDALKVDAKTQEERKKAVAEIYSTMDASAAAAMLGKAAELQDAADILNMLSSDKSAAILAVMDAKKAYDLTKLMMK